MMLSHLAIAPIIIPLAVAALQLLLRPRWQRTRALLSLLSCALLLACAITLLLHASGGHTVVYNIGGWPAAFSIVLVVDRLAALMLLLTAVVALAVAPHALGRWQYRGSHFQPLMQLLLMGFNGAFLTGDLFNLFVFFEIVLAASYALALHGSGARRVGASLHYIAVNLVASMLFLLGVSLIFGVTGSLNMATLARLIPTIDADTRALLHAGAALLAMAFLIKAAVWPLGFWLPRTYAAATPPAAALFALMTKLGLYVLLRLSLLLFGANVGAASAHFGSSVLLWLGIATLVVGAIGMLGARELGKLIGYNVLVSSGTLLGAIALQQPAVTAGALAYLVISVLAIAAFFLLTGLVVPHEEPEDAQQLEPYNPAGDELYADEVEHIPTAPTPVVVLATCFFACAVLLVGLPPLAGFLAKFAMLKAMVGGTPAATVLFVAILLAGLFTLIALCRAGIQIFWADDDWIFPHVRRSETTTVAALLGLCLLLTFAPAAPWRYVTAAAQQLHVPDNYIEAVLTAADGRSP